MRKLCCALDSNGHGTFSFSRRAGKNFTRNFECKSGG